MVKLQKEFKKFGDIFKEEKRINNVAIYSRSFKNKIQEYEVIIIKVSQHEWKVGDIVITNVGDELYPSNSQWGLLGWTTNSYERAEEIMNRELSK